MKRLTCIAVFLFLVCAPVFSGKAEIKAAGAESEAQKQVINQIQDQSDKNKTFLLSLNSAFLFGIGIQIRMEMPINDFIGIGLTGEYRYYDFTMATGLEINWYIGGQAPNSFFIGPLGGINWYQFKDDVFGNITAIPALMDFYYGAHIGYRWIFGGFFLDLAFGSKYTYLRIKDYFGKEYRQEGIDFDPQINIGWAW
jgi:hypothetical protein